MLFQIFYDLRIPVRLDVDAVAGVEAVEEISGLVAHHAEKINVFRVIFTGERFDELGIKHRTVRIVKLVHWCVAPDGNEREKIDLRARLRFFYKIEDRPHGVHEPFHTVVTQRTVVDA